MTDHEYNYRVPWGISGQRQLSDVRCMSCAIAESQKVDGCLRFIRRFKTHNEAQALSGILVFNTLKFGVVNSYFDGGYENNSLNHFNEIFWECRECKFQTSVYA